MLLLALGMDWDHKNKKPIIYLKELTCQTKHKSGLKTPVTAQT